MGIVHLGHLYVACGKCNRFAAGSGAMFAFLAVSIAQPGTLGIFSPRLGLFRRLEGARYGPQGFSRVHLKRDDWGSPPVGLGVP